VPLTLPAGHRLRRALPADADALAQLRYEFRAALDPTTETAAGFVERCAEWMRHQLAACGPWHAWLIERDREVIGTIWLELFEKLPNPIAERERHGYITNLYVRAEARETGLGTALLAAALAECEAGRVDAVLLWPTARSRSLYQRQGFAAAGDLLERRLAPTPRHSLDTG
jgi:GNAT superfamily N-acetyltransferase